MKKVTIIAEAGVNHNGDIELAKKLVDVAVAARADFVKFQTFKSENVVSKTAKKALYQTKNTKDTFQNQFQMLKKLELSHEHHLELISYCKQKNISFFSTAFDLESLVYLKKSGLKMVKIPSGEITNLPYLRKAAELFSEVIEFSSVFVFVLFLRGAAFACKINSKCHVTSHARSSVLSIILLISAQGPNL